MDTSIQKSLHDKLYDKRKGGALELERLVRDCLAAGNHERIAKIIDQLCHDYAYSIHQPNARNGGLIGLAAASIALGPEVAAYLEQIVPPILACFSDHDARVRYYACESMYNIAKTSKGEILVYFNEVFDALAKLAADQEPSVKNGAELLDRLIKDIISESATSYVSVLLDPRNTPTDTANTSEADTVEQPTAFSLPRFIPLLKERIFVINPFTRMFLVSWIILLDSIPDLELVSYLPSFLEGLFRFLNDSNQDVVTSTQHVLERFLEEIRTVAAVKKDISETTIRNARSRASSTRSRLSGMTLETFPTQDTGPTIESEALRTETSGPDSDIADDDKRDTNNENSATDTSSEMSLLEDNWMPGQDVHVDYPQIIDILVKVLGSASEEHIQLTALRWMDTFFEICPHEVIPFVPSLLDHVLPALSSDVHQVQLAATKVNHSLMEYIVSLPDTMENHEEKRGGKELSSQNADGAKESRISSRPESAEEDLEEHPTEQNKAISIETPPKPTSPRTNGNRAINPSSLNYEAAVNSLTMQFLNKNEATRVAALSWLLMLQRKAPRRVLAAHDGAFPALLKTLSDPSDTVVTRDLQLLCQISVNSDETFFTFFMVNLLKLFSNNRKLLETRGSLVIRQLCTNLNPERIYRTLAECLEKADVDLEFAGILVQNLNNNLITAPELADLRRRLRTWENREAQTLFVGLFRAWCHNAISTICLCLLAQAYEQAYHLLQIFTEIEISVDMLIQIDKLVQLLESPVFTFLRLQLLEPAQYPFLYKTLYGILMLLPQSAAFAALKNRLNSVSPVAYLHMPNIAPAPGSATARAVTGTGSSTSNPTPSFDRPNRLISKPGSGGRDPNEAVVKWSELLEKFRSTQRQNLAPTSANTMPASGAGAGKDGAGSRPWSAASTQAMLDSGPGPTLVETRDPTFKSGQAQYQGQGQTHGRLPAPLDTSISNTADRSSMYGGTGKVGIASGSAMGTHLSLGRSREPGSGTNSPAPSITSTTPGGVGPASLVGGTTFSQPRSGSLSGHSTNTTGSGTGIKSKVGMPHLGIGKLASGVRGKAKGNGGGTPK